MLQFRRVPVSVACLPALPPSRVDDRAVVDRLPAGGTVAAWYGSEQVLVRSVLRRVVSCPGQRPPVSNPEKSNRSTCSTSSPSRVTAMISFDAIWAISTPGGRTTVPLRWPR